MNRHAFVLFLCLISGMLVVPSSFCAEEKTGTLANYLEQALAGNDTLLAARAKFGASTEKKRQTGILPDPKLAVQYYLRPVETRTGAQQASIGISQSVPWFGKLSLMRSLADHEENIAGAEVAVAELNVARQVKEVYIEYGFLGRAQQVVADNLELLRYLEGVARDRYVSGKTTFFDVLKIQIELAQTEEKARTLKDQARPLRIRINNLLGTESERKRVLPKSLPKVILKKKEAAIYAIALKNAPLLQAAQERIAKAKTGKELAERDFYPDFGFSLTTLFTDSAEYGDPPDSGMDPIIAGVTMNLPIFRERRQAKLAEQEEVMKAARSSQEGQKRLLQNKIEQGLYAYRNAQRRLALYQNELLPKVKQQLEVAVSGFQSGKNSILEIIDAEKNLLTFDLAESRAVADRALAVAGLEEQAGIVLTTWEKQDDKEDTEKVE